MVAFWNQQTDQSVNHNSQATESSGFMPDNADQPKSNLAYKLNREITEEQKNDCLDVWPISKVAIHGDKQSHRFDNDVFRRQAGFYTGPILGAITCS